jgi:hypothetical protein
MEEKIKHYLEMFGNFHLYDFEGNELSIKNCFDGAQSYYPPTVFLAPPEQVYNQFPIPL